MEEDKLSIQELVRTEGWKIFSKKLELYTAILLGITIVLWIAGFSHKHPFAMLLTASLTSMAILCFFMGFNIFESDSKIISFLFYKLYGFGLAIGFITVLFIHQHWPGANEIMLLLSTGMILISSILGIREIMGENKNNIDWKYFARIILAFIPLFYYIIHSF